MGKNCKVRDKWFEETDPNGYKYKSWLRKKGDHVAFCIICAKEVNVFHCGLQAVQKHASTPTHKGNCRIKLEEKQLRLVGVDGNSDVPCNNGPVSKLLDMFSLKRHVIKAELIWSIKTITSNMSAASCDGIGDVFSSMFSCETSTKFSMSRTKLGYYITEALGPFFHKQILEDLSNAPYYSLAFDETTNKESQKELQVRIRFWSTEETRIVTKHLETFFIGTATAEAILLKLNIAINNGGLIKSNMLMLASDGPNVNKKIFTLMNEEVKSLRGKSLLDLGSCNLHICHNAFLKGLEAFGTEVDDFIIHVYYFFKGWPKRQEDYFKIQVELNVPTSKFIKHVSSRWLTMLDSAQRVLEQWPAIRKYFLTFIPSQRKRLASTLKYKSITRCLADKSFKAKIFFVIESATTVTQFTRFFQKDEPLIHLLYDELLNLFTTLLLKFCKDTTSFDISKDDKDVIFDRKNYLALQKIDIGSDARKLLNEPGFKDLDRISFYKGAQEHYIAAAKHILIKSSLNQNYFLKHCRNLQPNQIKASSSNSIQKIAEKLPIQNINLILLKNEWQLLKREEMVINYQATSENNTSIISFWKEILNIKHSDNVTIKYPNVMKVVKATLSLSHGSADVERGFSRSKRILTNEKTSMLCRTLNARLNVIDGIAKYEKKPNLVPITNDLLQMAILAHKNYQAYLEEEREEKKRLTEQNLEDQQELEAAQQVVKTLTTESKSIEKMEVELKSKEKELYQQSKAADTILKQANEQLQSAINKGDFTEVRIAQGLLEGYKELRQKETKNLDQTKKIEKTINKRKGNIITTFLKKHKTEHKT